MSNTINKICGIALSILLIVTGALLMIACVNIYKIGARPFTPENISAEFSKISVPVFITLGALAVGGIIALIFPEEKNKPRAIRDKKFTLSRLLERLDTNACHADKLASIEKERKLCRLLRIGALLLCIASAIPALIHSLNFNNFGADYNASVIQACALVLPCAFISMGVCIAYVYVESASIERQIKLVKAAIAESSASLSKVAPKARKSYSKITLCIRVTLAVLALAFIVAGILNGGMADVLAKAIAICTECIGLG